MEHSHPSQALFLGLLQGFETQQTLAVAQQLQMQLSVDRLEAQGSLLLQGFENWQAERLSGTACFWVLEAAVEGWEVWLSGMEGS